MKKTRILSLILALVMLVSLIPVSAMAMTVTIIGAAYEDNSAKLSDAPFDSAILETKEGDKKVTVSTKDYDELLVDMVTGELYEIIGLHVLNNKVLAELEKTAAANGTSSVTVVAPPEAADYATTEEYEAAYTAWAEANSDFVLVTYGPHTHNLGKWESDPTNHWRNCLQCKEEYLLNNWHYDGDDDDKCDVCKADIVYYSITVPEVEGVKEVILDGPKEDSTAAYNDKITVAVEAEEGYEIKDVRVYKIREDGTKNQIVRSIVEYYEVYEFVMQNFDCEIVITCQKK